MHKRAIIFDIDGTLIDSNEFHVQAWQQAFSASGFVFSRSEIHGQLGKGGDNLVPSLLPDVENELRGKLSAAEGDIYKRQYLPGVEPFPGVQDALKQLARKGHTLVLASSASRSEVDRYIQLLDAEGVISGATSRDDVGHSKPCPDIFEAALEQSGCARESAVVVGDSPYDLIAAHRAGLESIAVLSGGFEKAELLACDPAAIYRDVAGLLADYERSPLHDVSPALT